MKKFIKSIVALTALTLVAAPICARGKVANAQADSGKAVTVYSTDDKYNYRLSDAFTRSPDSFEAWVNLPEYSVGGTVMGNYLNNIIGYTGSVDWEVDALGRIRVFWDNGAFDHTFDNEPINDGTWHHIALVRDKELRTFTLWIDGETDSTVSVKVRDAVCLMPMNIGVDYKNWTMYKQPLDGTVRQITVYNGAIDGERIAHDMAERDITDTYDGALIGNWNFGDTWTKEQVEETSGSGNTAELVTFEKYVPIESTGEYDYTLVGIPDIQSMVNHRPNDLNNAMQWIKNNAESQKISFAIQVGDLSDNGGVEGFYRTAAEQMSVLDGAVPYSFVQGNHDYDDNSTRSRSSVLFNRYFTYSKYSQNAWFGGAFEQGSMSNTYNLFTAGGVDYLVINLEFGPRMSVIRWAGRLCEAYPDRRVIINTHGYLDPDGSIMTGKSRFPATNYDFSNYIEATDGMQLYDGLIRRYENIFMVLCGHNCTDDSVVRTDVGDHGNTIISMLIDPQCSRVNGAAWGEDPVMLMRFNESKRTIDCVFYSAKYDKCFNMQNQYTLHF